MTAHRRTARGLIGGIEARKTSVHAREPRPASAVELQAEATFTAMLIASAIISGLGLGSMYGLFALGFHVTHAVSRTVNFAQGSTMMLGAVLCFTLWVTCGCPLP